MGHQQLSIILGCMSDAELVDAMEALRAERRRPGIDEWDLKTAMTQLTAILVELELRRELTDVSGDEPGAGGSTGRAA